MGDCAAPRFAELALIYRKLLGARIRADWQYRVSFALFTVGQALALTLDLLTIVVVFGRVSRLAGWSFDEVLFLYGTSAVAFGLGDVFVSPVEKVAFHIKHGSFDRFLLRPVSPLLQLCCDEFALRRVGKLVPPVVTLGVVVARLDLGWTPLHAAVLAATLASGTLIFSALWVLTSSLAFWTVETQELSNTVTYGGSFMTQYPLDVLTPWLRRLVVLIPLAFVNYLPATWLLRRADATGLPPWAPFLSPAVALVLSAVAASLWRSGIRHYRSTGS